MLAKKTKITDTFDKSIEQLLDKYTETTDLYNTERAKLTRGEESYYSADVLNKMLDDISNLSQMMADLIDKRNALK